LVLALANPSPEIMPEDALAARPDAMICTGRSDYPNQVNNVLCFPYIFRGALDVGATTINEDMKRAAVHAIAELARESAIRHRGTRVRRGNAVVREGLAHPLAVRSAPHPAGGTRLLPAPRWTAAWPRGPIADFDAYVDNLQRFVFKSGFVMRATSLPRRRKRRAA
jgi:malate dehydrogenase (oxaloacetate-decarboxylating)(NADP+)